MFNLERKLLSKEECPDCHISIYDMERLEDEYTLPNDPREYQLYRCKCGNELLHFYDADKDKDFTWKIERKIIGRRKKNEESNK